VRFSLFYRHVVSAETNCLQPAAASFLLSLLFRHENGGSVSLRNVELSANYTALRIRRPYSLSYRFLTEETMWDAPPYRRLLTFRRNALPAFIFRLEE
jgi:hypothetical protein